jgi:hypothetical protein
MLLSKDLWRNYRLHIDLHIGAPKAGSTAIQQFLANNRLTLKRAGLSVVTLNHPEFRAFKDATNKSKFAPLARRRSWPFLQKLNARISNSPNSRGIISSEYLFQIQNEWAIRLFRDITFNQNDTLNVLLYLRDPVSTKRAMYSTAIHLGAVIPYSRYQSRLFSLQAHQLVNKWRAVFGENRLSVQLYDRSQFPERDIKKSLVEYLRLTSTDKFNLDELDYVTGRDNSSHSPADLEIIRALNVAHRKLAQTVTRTAPSHYQEKWLAIAKTRIAVPDVRWSEDNLGHMPLSRQQNQLIMKEYFPELDKSWFEEQSTLYLDQLPMNDKALHDTYCAAEELLAEHMRKDPSLQFLEFETE